MLAKGEEGAKHTLVRHNIRLAWFFAQRFGGRGNEADFFSEAAVGLCKAAVGFARRADRAKPAVERDSTAAFGRATYLRDAAALPG